MLNHTRRPLMITSKPGKITGGISLVVLIALLVMLFVIKMFKEAPKFTIIVLTMFLISALLNTFEIDCLVVGDCSTWAWIRTALGIIMSSFLVVILVSISVTGMLIGNATKEEKVEKK